MNMQRYKIVSSAFEFSLSSYKDKAHVEAVKCAVERLDRFGALARAILAVRDEMNRLTRTV